MAQTKLPKTEKELKALLKETLKKKKANDKEYNALETLEYKIEDALQKLADK